MLLLCLAATANLSALDEANCDTEIASIDYGEDSKLKDSRFRYVFASTGEYPYYRKLEDVFIGVETNLHVPNSRRPGERLWTNLYGRKNVGARGHYSLIHEFSGSTMFRGVSVGVTADKEFAFILHVRERDNSDSAQICA